jgi:hypothetical protein
MWRSAAAQLRDDALVAWVAGLVSGIYARGSGGSVGFVDDAPAEDSTDSFYETVDAAFEQLAGRGLSGSSSR